MKILSSFVFKEFVKYFLPLWLSLGALFYIFEILGRVFLAKLSFFELAALYLYKIPFFLSLSFTVALLLALLLCVGKMNQSRELVAVQAMGVGYFSFVKNLLGPIIVLLPVYFMLVNFWQPKSQQIFHQKSIEAKSSLLSSIKNSSEKKQFWFHHENKIVSVKSFDKTKALLNGVEVFYLDNDSKLSSYLSSDTAFIRGKSWTLKNPQVLGSLDDKKKHFYKKSKSIVLPLMLGEEAFVDSNLIEEHMSSLSILKRLTVKGLSSSSIKALLTQLYFRINLFLVPILLFLIFLFKLSRFERSVSLAKDFLSIAIICSLYWFVLSLFVQSSYKLIIEPLWVLVGPLLLLFAAFILWRLARVRALSFA